MASNSLSRKDFIVLTFTLVGSAAVGLDCGSSSSNKDAGGGSGGGGRGGSGGGGAGGGAAGSGGGGSGGGGRGGSGGGGSGGGGAGGGDGGAGRDGGGAGTDGGGGGAAGGDGSALTNSCDSTLPESQLPDATNHMHTVTITSAQLNQTANLTVNTSLTGNGAAAHMHMVTLTGANLATLRGGGLVTVTSSSAGTTAHTHTYQISCHAVDGGTDAASGGDAASTG
jgi:hypothetical protein